MKARQAMKATRTAAGVAMLCALALAGCKPKDFPQYPANYREYAYVTNTGSGTVSVYDVVNVRLDREIAVSANPVAVTASPVKNEVYVVNAGTAGGNGFVTVIDAEKNAVAAVIAVHRQPAALALDPEGAVAYVANAASNSVSVVDLKTRREVAVIGTGETPSAVRVAPDGTVTTLLTASDGLDGPTATAFGVGADRENLYITNAAFPFFPGTRCSSDANSWSSNPPFPRTRNMRGSRWRPGVTSISRNPPR